MSDAVLHVAIATTDGGSDGVETLLSIISAEYGTVITSGGLHGTRSQGLLPIAGRRRQEVADTVPSGAVLRVSGNVYIDGMITAWMEDNGNDLRVRWVDVSY